ncbi:MAG: 50S ribosomal protein L18 [Bacteroidota bacterium]
MGTQKTSRRLRIRQSIRRRLRGTESVPRLSIFKSNKTIYAQVINDDSGHTMAFASSKELGSAESVNIDSSKKVGQKIAERAIASGIEKVVFDRGGYLYHGKIKALADGAREGGLKF